MSPVERNHHTVWKVQFRKDGLSLALTTIFSHHMNSSGLANFTIQPYGIGANGSIQYLTSRTEKPERKDGLITEAAL